MANWFAAILGFSEEIRSIISDTFSYYLPPINPSILALKQAQRQMRFLRFSIRRLLLLTGLIAVLLYFLLIRPVTVAKEFVHTVRTADVKEIRKYLDNVIGEGAYVEGVLDERSWADLFRCRQRFAISVVRPLPERFTTEIIEKHDCYSTPFGVQQQEPYLQTRPTKQR